MKIYENMVLQYLEEDGKNIRIVFIDNLLGYCYIVELGGETAMPQFKLLDEINNLIENEELILVAEPYDQIFIEDEILYKYRIARDENWNIVEYLWNQNRKEFLDKNLRSKILVDTSLKYNRSIKQVKRIITRYLQRGMKKNNALIFDYRNSGGKGKKKTGEKKRGRRRESDKNGEPREGININDTILNIIKISIKLFYLKKEQKSFAEAHILMLKKFFSDKLIFDNHQKSFVWDVSRIPSYRQFVYWFYVLEDKKETIITRNSEKYYELNKRELLSNSTLGVFGPGSRYQIDATAADVYLVSMSDGKRIIGRPVVYDVIDVFSRLICGIYVGLEGPSWLGAMMALDNVIEDKVQFCLKYGIEINNEQWPNSYLPEKILADRGEFEGYNVENLINNLNIKIENTAPYRGDLKGIVERNFRTTNEMIKHMAPGAIAKQFRERGDRNYMLDAVLNIEEFTAIIISEVINHNNSIINGYPMDIEMIKDDVPPTPTTIWNWGMENRRCALKYIEKDIVRLNLMYRKKVTITRKGIQFNSKMFYSCELAIKEGWYLRRVSEKFNIVYDPRKMNHIYIPLDNGSSFIKCDLLEKSARYKDLPLEEVIFIEELEKENINYYQNTQNQIDVDKIETTEKIIEKAKEKAKLIVSSSDRQRVKNIKKHRGEEKEDIRNLEGFELNRLQSKNISTKNYEDKIIDEDSEISSKMDLFKKVRGEKAGQ
ncbi:MAG: hypothetical protein ACI8WT_001378 [Clostridium sp.]|jgi:hypothetical protein